jgi:RNA polymerase sigma-70 factor (ECF subfamily)
MSTRIDRFRSIAALAGALTGRGHSRVTTRLCLDHLKSARVRRESYVGGWSPEPVPTDAGSEWSGSREDVSVGLLVALERLSPLERVAFLLHDVFDVDVDFASVAEALERSEAPCRQLAARAREHVVHGDRIAAIYSMRNPDELTHLL